MRWIILYIAFIAQLTINLIVLNRYYKLGDICECYTSGESKWCGCFHRELKKQVDQSKVN